MADEAIRSGRLSGTTRVEAFSDGVMAIAITLLILDIRVPEHQPGQLLEALAHIWPSYVAYLAAFLTVGIVWMNHHTYFGRLRRLDHVIRWWNLMLLLGVSVLPFPTGILAENVVHGAHRDAQVAAALFGLAGVLMTVPWWPLHRRLVHHPELFEPGFDAEFARRESFRAWPGIAIYAVCIVIGFIMPIAALALYLIIAIFYAFTSQGWGDPAVAESE
ncbi:MULTISPECIES: TMEM175 family protein [unclassified Nocardia]|uniref:TMEM175 family protein n=1 Tax=unclassified Nocardia TaxID=2637762 RepID=UPI001CE3E8B9|nr:MULTISPECIES: TMEM175 family protein [unclassified Nocardia]